METNFNFEQWIIENYPLGMIGIVLSAIILILITVVLISYFSYKKEQRDLKKEGKIKISGKDPAYWDQDRTDYYFHKKTVAKSRFENL